MKREKKYEKNEEHGREKQRHKYRRKRNCVLVLELPFVCIRFFILNGVSRERKTSSRRGKNCVNSDGCVFLKKTIRK